MLIKRIAIIGFFLWLAHNIYVVTSKFQWPYLGAGWVGYCIGYNVADFRLWALGIGIVVLRRRDGSWWGGPKPKDSSHE